MDLNTALVLLIALFFKHFVYDFVAQTPYQYLNKGTYGHPGGITHSLAQAVATALCIILVVNKDSYEAGLLFGIILIEFTVHYHMDYIKVNINRFFSLKPNEDYFYWVLLGFDQLVHSLTYVWVVYILSAR